MLWQIPFGTMAAVGAILTLAFHYIPSSEHVIRAILFIALAWFTLAMMHLSYKVRHFQIERSACAEAIEQLCLGFTVPYETRGAEDILGEEIRRNPLGPLGRPLERGFYRVRSYHLIYLMYIGLMAMLLYLAFTELLPFPICSKICLNTIKILNSIIYIPYFNFTRFSINFIHYSIPTTQGWLAAACAVVATIALLIIIIYIGYIIIGIERRRRR